MKKEVYKKEYRDFTICIYATYSSEYRQSVSLHYFVYDKQDNIKSRSIYPHVVIKENNILSWLFESKDAFYKKVNKKIAVVVNEVQESIDRDYHDKEINDGLLESLKSL